MKADESTKSGSKYLRKEQPLVIDRELAAILGLNESIVLQQVEYWINKYKTKDDKRHYHEGKWWIYNSYESWQENFPFWSKSTIRRAIKSLEDKEILITANYNKLKIDRTKWYSINYQMLDNHCDKATVQNEQLDRSKWTDGDSKLNRPLPKITSKSTSENTKIQMCGNQKSSSHSCTYSFTAPEVQEILVSEFKNYAAEITSMIEYYFNKYREVKGRKHPKITLSNWQNIFDSLTAVELKHDSRELLPEEFEQMVDEYFDHNYRQEIDHKLEHLVSGKIMENLYYNSNLY